MTNEPTPDRLSRIARGWDEAATGYETYFVPRFAPWVRAAVDAIDESADAAAPPQPTATASSESRAAGPGAGGGLPEGAVLVPGCGTFPELELLVGRFPGRRMVRLARERAARLKASGVEVVQGDASTLDPRWSGACAAVVSVFGLQQLPEPAMAMRSWADALAPGGRMCVVYWPETPEEDGPFALMAEVIGDRVGRSWEGGLLDALDDVEIERDELVSYPMTHPDAATYFDEANHAGSMRALALARGDTYMRELREKYLEQAPAGEWTHHPRARLISVRKPPSRAAAAPPTS
jgi:SAM-dependent methyltransferase